MIDASAATLGATADDEEPEKQNVGDVRARIGTTVPETSPRATVAAIVTHVSTFSVPTTQ